MAKPDIGRRAFLRLSLLGGIGAGLAVLQHRTAEIGLMNFVRWSVRGGLRSIRPPAVVALGSNASYDEDLLSTLRDLWALAGMPDVGGKSILVKPNLLDQAESSLAATSPQVIAAILDLLAEMGAASVAVGDGSAFRRDTTSVADAAGLLHVLAERQIPFVDLNYDELSPVRARDGWFRNTDVIWLPNQAISADYILSVPRLKTHHWAGVTLSMKNLLGIIPGARYGWPKNIIHMNGINPSILGLFQSLPPVLAIVDGIRGMEGNGPLHGTLVQHGLLAVGADALAVDITCARLMGFDYASITHLAGAAWAGIGQSRRIELRGASPGQLQRQYKPPPKM